MRPSPYCKALAIQPDVPSLAELGTLYVADRKGKDFLQAH